MKNGVEERYGLCKQSKNGQKFKLDTEKLKETVNK